MTKLDRPVVREYTSEEGEDFVVTIHPNGLVAVREKRGREEFAIPIPNLYVYLVARAVEVRRQMKKTRRENVH